MRCLNVTIVAVALGACGGPNYAGTYAATYMGTFQNTTPNNLSGTYDDAATVTAVSLNASQLELRWQVGSNPPSGTIVFDLTGSTGTAVAGTGTSGKCFMGTLTNGNVQTSCCTQCTVTFTANGFTQAQQGTYSGTTPQSIAYTGTYSGTWSGTRQ
jgi:hypothetical protein